MNKEVASRNFNFCEQTKKLKDNIELNFLELGARLKKIQEEKLYEPNYESFFDYLKDLNIQTSVASRLISIFNLFIEKHKFKPKELVKVGGWSKLSEIVKVSETKKKAKEWLAYAEVNPQSVLRQMVKQEALPERKFDEKDFYIIKIFRSDGSKIVLADSRDENYKYEKWHDT